METNIKKNYVVPEFEIIELETEELLTTSSLNLQDVLDPNNENTIDGIDW